LTQKILLFLSCLFTVSILFSQKQNNSNSINISGKVVDTKTNQPLEYATIIIKNTETEKVSGGITDLNGEFSIEMPKATYQISVAFISFESAKFPKEKITSDKYLGIIKLAEATNGLNEIVIVAEKTTVDIRLDKKIFNIGKDLSIRGGNASDVLGNVPSVQVDVEGNVSLR
jgi:hypothetical protein